MEEIRDYYNLNILCIFTNTFWNIKKTNKQTKKYIGRQFKIASLSFSILVCHDIHVKIGSQIT